MKGKKTFISAVIAALLICLCILANSIFNQSCAGVTYYSGSGIVGMDVLVKYFESESKAKKFYKENDIAHYILVASDYSKNNLNTEEWFDTLTCPLVSEDRKICSIGYQDEIFDSDELLAEWLQNENLMVYYISDALKSADFDCKGDPTYNPLEHVTLYTRNIHKDYTESEMEYLLSIYSYGFGLCDALDCYKLSVEAEDTYSMAFWEVEIDKFFESFENVCMPEVEREDLIWSRTDRDLRKHIDELNLRFHQEKDNLSSSSYPLWVSYKFTLEGWLVSIIDKFSEDPAKIKGSDIISNSSLHSPSGNYQQEPVYQKLKQIETCTDPDVLLSILEELYGEELDTEFGETIYYITFERNSANDGYLAPYEDFSIGSYALFDTSNPMCKTAFSSDTYVFFIGYGDIPAFIMDCDGTYYSYSYNISNLEDGTHRHIVKGKIISDLFMCLHGYIDTTPEEKEYYHSEVIDMANYLKFENLVIDSLGENTGNISKTENPAADIFS